MGKRKLRRPFVVVWTLSATMGVTALAETACSSSSSSSGTSSGGSSSGSSGTSSGVVNPPGMADCPQPKPAMDSPCSDNGQVCDYGTPTFGCPDPDTQGRLQCMVGLWNAPATDPECAYPGPMCPATAAAAQGASCPATGSGICIYKDCEGVESVQFSCVNGHLMGDVPNCSGGDAGDSGGG